MSLGNLFGFSQSTVRCRGNLSPPTHPVEVVKKRDPRFRSGTFVSRPRGQSVSQRWSTSKKGRVVGRGIEESPGRKTNSTIQVPFSDSLHRGPGLTSHRWCKRRRCSGPLRRGRGPAPRDASYLTGTSGPNRDGTCPRRRRHNERKRLGRISRDSTWRCLSSEVPTDVGRSDGRTLPVGAPGTDGESPRENTSRPR